MGFLFLLFYFEIEYEVQFTIEHEPTVLSEHIASAILTSNW